MGQFSKPWEELTIADNYIFCKVMMNKDVCKELLEVLLDLQIEKINYLQTESVIENFYDSRSVRLDVMVKDSKKIYNIEMQSGNYKDIILRSRYYQSSMNVATTKRRTHFRDLKETYVIFICKDDPFGLGLARYTKVSKFLETDKISYDDKSHNVFYNCSGYEREENLEVKNVLRFIYELKADSELTKKIEQTTDEIKQSVDNRTEYMTVQDVIDEEKELAWERGREDGLERGRAEGLEQGLEQGHAEGLKEGVEQGLEQGIEQGLAKGSLQKAFESAKKLKENGVELSLIAKCTGLSLKEVQKL